MSYAEFLQHKKRIVHGMGIDAPSLPPTLYAWQTAIVRWALKKGRAAIWADCGLGKTFMQVAWSAALDEQTLIMAPLCVAEQTVAEALKLGVHVKYVRDQAEVDRRQNRGGLPSICITNYERLESFDPSQFGAVVLDESSILKAFDGKTRTRLIESFKHTPYRLCCTATPSPNDIAELANHAEFLGLMTRPEFLATWFIHDDAGWRMKRHAVQPFYRWLASWAIALRSPADLGYDETGFVLPALSIDDVVIESNAPSSSLFPELGLKGIGGRLSARRAALPDRIAAVVDLVQQNPDDQWLLWCGLNEESDALEDALDGSVNVQGSDTYAEKRGAVESFINGQTRYLISKLKVLGFGMNFQHCHRMAFVGMSDSYEGYYQGIRRCWRFGQQHPVSVEIVVSDAERAVVENVRRKEAIADALSRDLLAHMRDFEREEVCA